VNARIPSISEFILRLKCLFFLMIALAIPGFAQLSTATVMGIVQDSSKASLPDTAVKLINARTGTENDSITDSQGGFILPGILPGAYTLQITRQGFATTQLYGIILNVGDTKDLLIRMRIGSVTESVTVDASGLTLNATDASVSTVVDRRFVANVPLNGRSFQDLISMTPGIVTQSPQAAGQGSHTQGDFSVNGQRTESNAFFVDGVIANINSGLDSGHSRLSSTGSAAGSTALGTTQSLVSIDALQEFRVLSSTYSAEYGRTPGGQFTFLTRSGTNTIHGGLYGYFRNDVFDAADWFSTHEAGGGAVYPPATYNQADFGGTLGAPIVLPGTYNGRDRTFIFLSYEGLYLAQPTPQTFQYTPPSCGMPGCNPLQAVWNTFPGASPPEILDPSGNPSGLFQTILPSYALPAHVNSTSLRVDQTFSPKLSMFLRYAGTPSYSQTRQLWSVTANQVDTQTFTLGASHQLSTISSNEFRLGYAGNNSTLNTRTDPLDVYYASPPNLNSALGIAGSDDSVRGEVYIHIVGVGDSESNTDERSSSLHQWNVRDTFSLQSGNHLFKFGIDQRRVVSTVNPPALSVQAAFLDPESIANSLPSDLVITKSNSASPVLNEFSAFAEDQWRISQRLTLSLGLRWEVNPPPKGKHSTDAFTLDGDVSHPATLTLLPRGTPLWHTTWYNFAPRLGAAWAVSHEPGRELILRAGGGVFFDTGNRPGLSAFNGIGFTTSTHTTDAPLPVTQAQLDFPTAVVPPYTNTNAFAFPSHLQLPYSLQWDIGLEKALNKNQSFTISYVGAEGRRLLQEQRRNINQSNPDFADVSYFPAGVTSSYQALQAKFQRSLSHGVEALASYTWAHSLDYGSTDPRFPLVYGNSDLDVRHNVEGAISWDLPSPAANNLIKRKLLGDWGVDGRLMARTGFPVNLSGNFSFDVVTGDTYYSRVNLIPNRPLYLYGSEYPGGRIFNGGPNALSPAFGLPDGTGQGDAPRNLLRGFDAVQANITIRRDIHFHDRWNMQFGAEIFNLANRPNFGYIDPYLSDLLFGQSTKMLNQSFGGTGALYQQGGPRSIQFSLKLTF
jgi:Carboxypeptidase regulatory-like domain/TonB dependent receptor/TonB-dependent Receptor Plug Domain